MDEEPSVLLEAMEIMNQDQRSLRKLLRDPGANQARILDALTSMEHATLIALGESPPRLESVPEGELALWNVGYKRSLAHLLQQVLTMQQAALERDDEALAVAYAEIGQLKSTGHEEYRDR